MCSSATGREYQLIFAAPDSAAVLRSLAFLPQAKAMAEGAVDFVGDGDCMPCASFVLTPDGAYFFATTVVQDGRCSAG